MALFGRRIRAAQSDFSEALDTHASDGAAEETRGPWDSQGDPVPRGYLDLGAMYVPSIPGLQLRAQFEADKTTLRRILLVVGTSGVQVSVFAAPRSGGLWPGLIQQITDSLNQDGGEVTLVEGRYGDELHARVPLRLPNGANGFSAVRIIGIEGPRWLVRIDMQGAAAAGDEAQLAACYNIIDQLIVHRGKEPRVPLEMLQLRLPKGAVATDGAA